MPQLTRYSALVIVAALLCVLLTSIGYSEENELDVKFAGKVGNRWQLGTGDSHPAKHVEYEEIKLCEIMRSKFAIVKQKGKYGLLGRNAKEAVGITYDSIVYDDKYLYMAKSVDKKWLTDVFDFQLDIVLGDAQGILHCHEELKGNKTVFVQTTGNASTLLNKDGTLYVAYPGKVAGFGWNETVYVVENGNWYLYGFDGKRISDTAYKAVEKLMVKYDDKAISDSKLPHQYLEGYYLAKSDNEYCVLDSQGKSLYCAKQIRYLGNQLLFLKREDVYEISNIMTGAFQVVDGYVYPFSANIARVVTSKGCYYIDAELKKISENMYLEGSDSLFGYACVCQKAGKYYIVLHDGTPAFEKRYKKIVRTRDPIIFAAQSDEGVVLIKADGTPVYTEKGAILKDFVDCFEGIIVFLKNKKVIVVKDKGTAIELAQACDSLEIIADRYMIIRKGRRCAFADVFEGGCSLFEFDEIVVYNKFVRE